ncbi:hypothetical protein RB195_013437 [Necator americanus]|uniref:Uncharacterized protein n=1 Tax=Necator americanus TaxID=51031 RepID=A0ABR1DVG5_NECAM
MSSEDKEGCGRPPEVDDHLLEKIIEGDPLTTTREVAQELGSDHSTVVPHLEKIGKLKKLNKWVPTERGPKKPPF